MASAEPESKKDGRSLVAALQEEVKQERDEDLLDGNRVDLTVDRLSRQ